jgi:DNA helicase II / ATP-dependent DNA helicase PcrA
MSIHLTPKQQEIVDFDEGALVVLAGPGSGKTRVLTERVRHLLARPDEFFRVLALTFTNKAANEMMERLQDVATIKDRAFVGTIHSFCMEVLANRGKAVSIDGLPHIFESTDDRKKVLLQAVHADPELTALLQDAGDLKQQAGRLSAWLELIRTAKMNLRLPAMMEDDRERRLYEGYQAGLRASNALDFDDLLLLTYRLFQERPAIADFYRRQYRYICIDEAQDLNEAQYRVLRALCGSEYRNVMMVGDPRQAIFVFSGASPHYMDLFETDFGAQQVILDENFRSSQAVVRAATALDPDYHPDGKVPLPGLLLAQAAIDEEDEALWVVDRIQTLLKDGHPDVEDVITPESVAILGRNRYVFQAVERELTSRGLPFVKRLTSGAHRSESSLVAEWELSLRLVANPADRLHLGLLASKWNIIATVDDLLAGAPDGVTLIQRCQEHTTVANAPHILAAIQATDWSLPTFRLDQSIDVLEHAADTFPDDERALVTADVADWHKHWNMYVRASTNRFLPEFFAQVALGATQTPRDQGIALLSVHSAKGTEFDVIFIIGLCEGTFPDYRAKTVAEFDEEDRNAFVAVTRSRRLLHLSHPCNRLMPWGDLKAQRPSRYYETIAGVVSPDV